MQTFEYTSAVLHLEERCFALSDKNRLKGITAESAAVLTDLGTGGWELVSVVTPSSFLGTTKSMMAFFKRTKG
jgi:hypothetical protein